MKCSARGGDVGGAGLVPRPVGDDPDPPVRLGHGLQQGGSDDVTINDIEYNSTQTHLTKMILCNAYHY